MQKKPGRPKLPKSKAKGEMISFRVMPDERKKLVELADKDGLSLSEWLRKPVMAALDQRKKDPEPSEPVPATAPSAPVAG
jgi:hypothetical protein